MSLTNRSCRRKSFNILGHAHELTFSTYQRYPFFKSERCCQWLAEALDVARQRQNFLLWAYVFMPDHIHLIIYPTSEQHDMGRILETIKRPVGVKAINYVAKSSPAWLPRLTRQRGSCTERLFWQSGGGYDRNITSPKTLLRMIDYLHENPVRKNLILNCVDWRWSSASPYCGGASPLLIDPIPPEWLEVDA